MKTKKEILKMSEKELKNYKWNGDLDLNKENSNCSNCSNCFDCFNCFNCRNLKDGNKHQYKICNVQLTKEEYEKKMKEIAGEKESK